MNAAGEWELGAAWLYIKALVKKAGTPKPLLLAAIDAAANIRPGEASAILGHLTASNDEEIAGAAHEAIEMARLMSGETEDEEDLSDWIN